MYPFATTEADLLLEAEAGTGYEFVQIGRGRLVEFSDFVFRNFAQGIARRQSWRPTELDYVLMLQEERVLFETGLYILARSPGGQPLAALRAARWSPGLRLKTERVFQIDSTSLAQEWQVPREAIWHLSQLCVDHSAIRQIGLPASAGILLMRGLIRNMLYAARNVDARIGIMESDEQVSAYLWRLMQIRARKFTATRNYFGQTFVAHIDLDEVRQLAYTRKGNDISR